MIGNFFNTIDIYGSHYNFTIFGKSSYSTSIGGFITILTALCYILCFYYFGTNFYYRQNPNFLNQRITEPTYQKHLINPNDIIIAFRVEDLDGNFYDTSNMLDIHPIYFNLSKYNNGFSQNNSKLGYINCSSLNYATMKLNSTKKLDNMTCLGFNNTTMGGFWDSEFLYYISIYFKPCKNGNTRICKDLNKTIEMLNQGLLSFNIYTGLHFTDLNDYDMPLKLNLYNVYSVVDSNVGKNIRLFYKRANMTTDMALITSNPINSTVYGLDYFVIDTFPVYPPFNNPDDNTKIAVIDIFLNNNIETFEVVYIKFQQILATVGGITGLISSLFSVVAGIFNEHYKRLEIINKMFNFDELNEENKVNELIRLKIKKEKQFSNINKKRVDPLTDLYEINELNNCKFK